MKIVNNYLGSGVFLDIKRVFHKVSRKSSNTSLYYFLNYFTNSIEFFIFSNSFQVYMYTVSI